MNQGNPGQFSSQLKLGVPASQETLGYHPNIPLLPRSPPSCLTAPLLSPAADQPKDPCFLFTSDLQSADFVNPEGALRLSTWDGDSLPTGHGRVQNSQRSLEKQTW